MHLLVLGATGPSGIAFVEEALNQSHDLTIYARNTSKLPQHVQQHQKVKLIQGTFEDKDALREALQNGATVLISFLGPSVPDRGTPVSDFYKDTLFPSILEDKSCTIERCLCCTTPSFKVPEDQSSWKWWFLVLVIKWVGGSAYSEVNGIGRVVSALKPDELEWTLFRVPLLTKGDANGVRAGYIGEGQDGILLSRKSIAVWILQELEDRRWVGKAPALCNPGLI